MTRIRNNLECLGSESNFFVSVPYGYGTETALNGTVRYPKKKSRDFVVRIEHFPSATTENYLIDYVSFQLTEVLRHRTVPSYSTVTRTYSTGKSC